MAPQLPPSNWVERRTLPTFTFRKRSRTVLDTAEEAYLRLDIACGSPSCALCAPTLPALAPAPAHLLLPDAAVLAECLEVFELPQLENVVLLSSVVRQLHRGGSMRRDARLRALYADRRRRNVLFDDLHHQQTAPRSLSEQRAGLALLAAAEWYHEHLGSSLSVVVVSDVLAQQFGSGSAGGGMPDRQQPKQQPQQRGTNSHEDTELDALLQRMHVGGAGSGPAAAAAVGAASEDDIGRLLDALGIGGGERGPPPALPLARAQPSAATHVPLLLHRGVHILSAANYFGGCWGHDADVADVFDSIQQSKAEEAAGDARPGAGTAGFRPHLSGAALEAGLAAGSLLAGTLAVSRRVRDEATVAAGGRMLLITGRTAMNRAVHGDRVAVRLLPREQWRLAVATGTPGAGEGQAGEDGEAEEEEEEEHELLAAAGDGEADAAADVALGGHDEAADPVAELAGDAGMLQPTAEVVGVLQRWSGEVVACVSEEDEQALASQQDSGRQGAVLCIPTDRRLPKIRLRSRQLHRLLGQRFVLRLDGWEQGSRYPHGHLVRSLGPINSLTSETDGVLVSSGVHWQPFSEGALRELPAIASSAEYVMPRSEVAARRDLRGPEYLICSIDPPGCTDVDDALSVRWLERQEGGGGRQLVEVGVHIADVSFFVAQGGLLDGEAASRCTTVYLVDRRLDMLPALLSEDLCSLRSGQDRYAVSVLWTLDADSLEAVDVWFGRTLIRSRYQLEYSQAQAIMQGMAQPLQPPGKRGGGGTGEVAVPAADLPALQRNLQLLAALAQRRRERRLQDGAVELESAELRFRTDNAGQPTGVSVKREIEMMRVVAEMMILANAAVGARIQAAFPRAALLRRHPPPRREALAEVAALCETLGRPLELDGGDAALAASLAAAAAAAPPALASLIKSLATRAMSEAEYFCIGDVTGRGGAGMGHFGLALPHYTHFTSPIRRYADVVVHRQLLAAVAAGGGAAGAAPPPPPPPGAEVAERAAVMNERHRTAKRAQKECADLYLLLLLHAQPHVEVATVYALRPQALLVFLPKYHLKGVLHLTDKAGLPRPPLLQPGDELDDPLVLARRRGLALVAEGGGCGAPAELRLVEAAGGRQLAAFRPMQRVWVRLSADGSRAHGPRLRMRLLADGHPEARAAAAREGAQLAAVGTAGASCGGPARRPSPAPVAGVASGLLRGPPPGFGASPLAPAPAAVGAEAAGAPAAASSAAGGGGGGLAGSEPESLAELLQAFLEQQPAGGDKQDDRGCGPLSWEASLAPLELTSASGGDGSCSGVMQSVLHRAVRQLEARAARLQLRAAAGAPGRPRAEQCGAAAAAVRQQLRALQQHPVPG